MLCLCAVHFHGRLRSIRRAELSESKQDQPHLCIDSSFACVREGLQKVYSNTRGHWCEAAYSVSWDATRSEYEQHGSGVVHMFCKVQQDPGLLQPMSSRSCLGCLQLCTEVDTKSPGNAKTGLTGALQGPQVSFWVTGDPQAANIVAPMTTFRSRSSDLQLTTLVALLASARTFGVNLRMRDGLQQQQQQQYIHRSTRTLKSACGI